MNIEIISEFTRNSKVYKHLYWEEDGGEIKKILRKLDEDELRTILDATKRYDNTGKPLASHAVIARIDDKYEFWITPKNILELLPKKS